MLRKRKEDQDHYRNVQTTKKVKVDKKTERVTPTKVTISSFFNKRRADDRAEDRARPPSQSPRVITEVSGASADRPRYSEHPA
eukprot:12463676-Heterocapsa_arctica.AAC.1